MSILESISLMSTIATDFGDLITLLLFAGFLLTLRAEDGIN